MVWSIFPHDLSWLGEGRIWDDDTISFWASGHAYVQNEGDRYPDGFPCQLNWDFHCFTYMSIIRDFKTNTQ